MGYERYKTLKFARPAPGVLEILMGKEGKLATAGMDGHHELGDVWRDVDADPETRVAILRSLGKGFSGGGDFSMIEAVMRDFAAGVNYGASDPRKDGAAIPELPPPM